MKAAAALAALLVAPAPALAEPADICAAMGRSLPADFGQAWGIDGLAGPALGERLLVAQPSPEVTAPEGDWLDLARFGAWLGGQDWLAPDMKGAMMEMADYGGGNLYELDSAPPVTVLETISGTLHCQTLLIYARERNGRGVAWEPPGGEPGSWCYSSFLHPVALDGAPALIGRSDGDGQTRLEVFPLPTEPETPPACSLTVRYHDAFDVQTLHCAAGDCGRFASLLAGRIEIDEAEEAVAALPPPETTPGMDSLWGDYAASGQILLEEGEDRLVAELGALTIGWREFDGYGVRLFRLTGDAPVLVGLFQVERLNGAIQEVSVEPSR